MPNPTARLVLSNPNISKMGAANVLDISLDGANFKATGAIVIYE